jgi:hypothetical protein
MWQKHQSSLAHCAADTVSTPETQPEEALQKCSTSVFDDPVPAQKYLRYSVTPISISQIRVMLPRWRLKRDYLNSQDVNISVHC